MEWLTYRDITSFGISMTKNPYKHVSSPTGVNFHRSAHAYDIRIQPFLFIHKQIYNRHINKTKKGKN